MSENKINHQDIEISQLRNLLVRQDRIECDPERNVIKFNSEKFGKVVNISTFGLAIETDFEVENSYEDCVFIVDNYPVCEISLEKVRSRDLPDGRIVTGFSVRGNPLDVEAAVAIKNLNEILEANTKTDKKDSELIELFRLKVYEVNNALTTLQNKVNELSPSTFQNELNLVSNFENRIADRVSQYISLMLSPLFVELKEILEKIDKSEVERYFEFFRRSLGHIMYQSSYAYRAFHKPRGYAGDYEMMNHVYKRELRGETLFGKCLQRYFVDEPAGKAVRNREVYLRKKIHEVYKNRNPQEKLKILSVASGPAMEIQNIIGDSNIDLSQVEFHLLDQDLDALKHAQRRIKELATEKKLSVNLHLHNLAIRNVIQEGLPIKGFHMVYTAGLFDYFTDPVAVFAAQKLCDGLLPNGLLVIGNFSVNNPNQLVMGLVMDWNLVYRSELKMKELFDKVGRSYNLEQEDEGINLFANIRK